MVTKAAAHTKLDPKLFDFNSVMARTKAPKPKSVSVFLRPDVVPRILELEDQIMKSLGDQPEPNSERAIGDVPSDVDADVDVLEAELDALKEQFNDSELAFEFRPAKLSDNTKARAAMVEDKRDMTGDEADEISISYMLAETCISAGWTGAQFHQFREEIGEAAFRPLFNAAIEANAGPAVSAPFSRRPSRGLTTAK